MLEDDPHNYCFVGIDSETNALPIGSVRDLWNSEALAKLQPKIDYAEQWALEGGREVCANLVRRFTTNAW